MYLQNLQLEQLNYDVLKSELLNQIETEEIPTLGEVKNSLAEMYYQASEATASQYYNNLESFSLAKKQHFSFALAGLNLWEKLRRFLCGFLNTASTASEIIDKIVEWVASFIPGGVFISFLVKKIIKYVLNKGYESLCPVGD